MTHASVEVYINAQTPTEQPFEAAISLLCNISCSMPLAVKEVKRLDINNLRHSSLDSDDAFLLRY